tara:strand:- start:616 stop:1152 length:537 start_codon:yes stop_codon:yes gene_type:complete
MGIFGKTFAREMGKNTGKFVSNKVFGKAGHATPIRVIRSSEGSTSGAQQGSTPAAQPKGPGAMTTLIKGTSSMYGGMMEDERREKEEKKKAREEKVLKLDNLASMSIGNEKDEIAENLNFLVATANGQNDRKVKNTCIEKIEFGILKLRSNENHAEADFFQKKVDELSKKKGLFGFLK